MPYPTRPAPPNGPGTCPRCDEAVIWCITTANKVPIAVDPDRDPRGNQAVHQDRTGRWIARQLTKDRATPEGAEALYVPHVVTCPVARATADRTRAAARRRTTSRATTGVRPVRWQW
ncbi:hypothetical protein QF032_001361 [Streptomyces achromogenes]|uniref:hypothetical protein n=1 Tax=Streptomyces achromogenes TaxID=67255 RepID=UPI0027863B64|nr:hypothetical protein [Streptomyces achromogenes]MDQ0829517.1 hypothetical protein [Streptomyces achromogenes]